MKCKYKKAFSGVSKIRKFVLDEPALNVCQDLLSDKNERRKLEAFRISKNQHNNKNMDKHNRKEL